MRDEAIMIFWVLLTLALVAISVTALIDLHNPTDSKYHHECQVICQSSDYTYIALGR
jgi:hypothetical protein